MRRIIVVGGSLAGHQTARWLRVLGFEGELTVLGAEAHRPYDRYPLSKTYLAGDLDRNGLEIEPHDLDVRWRFGQAATGLDLAGRYVTINETDRAHFDGLVVATGSRPRVPFSVSGEVAGVFALRTVEDATALKDALSGARSRLVVVGGGLIGAEVASMATAAGHLATLVDSAPLPTSRALGVRVAEHLRTLHVANGVRLLTGSRVRALDVHGGQVGGVHLNTGLRLDADVVVLATGTQPNVEWLHGSGLDLSNGLSLPCHPARQWFRHRGRRGRCRPRAPPRPRWRVGQGGALGERTPPGQRCGRKPSDWSLPWMPPERTPYVRHHDPRCCHPRPRLPIARRRQRSRVGLDPRRRGSRGDASPRSSRRGGRCQRHGQLPLLHDRWATAEGSALADGPAAVP